MLALFDVLSQPPKSPSSNIAYKIPCKSYLRLRFRWLQLPTAWVLNKEILLTIQSEVSWSSLLSFLHFRRKRFTTDGAVTRIEFQLPHLKKTSSSNKDLHPDCIFWNPAKLQAEQRFPDWIFLSTKGCGEWLSLIQKNLRPVQMCILCAVREELTYICRVCLTKCILCFRQGRVYPLFL